MEIGGNFWIDTVVFILRRVRWLIVSFMFGKVKAQVGCSSDTSQWTFVIYRTYLDNPYLLEDIIHGLELQ